MESATHGRLSSTAPARAADAVVARRLRVGLIVFALVVAVSGASDLLALRGAIPRLHVVQLFQLVGLGLCWTLLSRAREAWAPWLAFAVVAFLSFTTVATSVATGDETTGPLLLSTLLIGSGAFVPWGAALQAAAGIVVVAATIANRGWVNGSADWWSDYPVPTAVAVAATVSVYLARATRAGIADRVRRDDERWQAERQARRRNRELERRVHARTAELERANRELREMLDRQRRSEEAQRRSEERFALAVAGANDGIWDWNLNTNEVYLSPRWKRILGCADSEIASDGETWRSRIHPEDRERVAGTLLDHLEGRSAFYEDEYRLLHRDGSYRWVLSRGLCVRDAGGMPTRMAGSLADVTTRRQALDEARDHQATLAHVLRVHTMDELASGIAHELSQPLSAILTSAHAARCRLEIGDAGAREVRRGLDRIESEAGRAAEILGRLRNFIRKRAPLRSRIDPAALVRTAARLPSAEAEKYGVTLRLDLEECPPIAADPVQVEQVILNLIRNAIEAITDGGQSAAEVRVELRATSGVAQVSVHDTGAGIIDPERIFAAFFTTKKSGLGLGLAISRSIVQAHGGRLWAERRPGGGSTLRFTLPIADADAGHAGDERRPAGTGRSAA